MDGLLSFVPDTVDELRAVVRDLKSLNDAGIAPHCNIVFFLPTAILTDAKVGSAVRTNLVGFKQVLMRDRTDLRNAPPIKPPPIAASEPEALSLLS
jgi:hypothetical protein